LPTNLENFTQKYLTKVTIFQKILGELLFIETPCKTFSASDSFTTFVVV